MIDGFERNRQTLDALFSDVEIYFEYRDKKYGFRNVKYTQRAIYPSVNEFKKRMDENNIEFRIISVKPIN